MSTVIERIKELCSQMRISENKLASEIGVNTQTLNNYTTGKRNVSYDVVDKILVRFPQVSAEWLIRGIGNMLNGCGCTSPDDPSLYHRSPSAPIDGVSTDLQRTHNGGTTEEEHIKDERIKLLEERIAFLEEQVEFYKNKK
jgi:transcriptional regulator with XRE-family HTH domain